MLVSQGVDAGRAGGRPARRWRRRDRRTHHLAALCRALLPVSRHADAALARHHLCRPVRARRTADRQERRPLLRPHRRLPRPAGVPAAGAVRALQPRGHRHHRRGHRSSSIATARSRASGWSGRVVPTYRPDTVIDADTAEFCRADSTRFGEITGCDIDSWEGYLEAHRRAPRRPSSELGATATDHGHPSARDRRSRPRRSGKRSTARCAAAAPTPASASCSARRC